VPDAWLVDDPVYTTPQAQRAAYRSYFGERLSVRASLVQEIRRAADQL